MRLRTWYTYSVLNFVEIAQRDLSLGGNFNQKFEIFVIFSYLSPYFYTDNVTILLKRTEDLGIHQRHKISSESLKGPAFIALPRGGDAYWFLVLFVFLRCYCFIFLLLLHLLRIKIIRILNHSLRRATDTCKYQFKNTAQLYVGLCPFTCNYSIVCSVISNIRHGTILTSVAIAAHRRKHSKNTQKSKQYFTVLCMHTVSQKLCIFVSVRTS